MERALLVTVDLKSDRTAWSSKDSAAELEELARSTGAEVIKSVVCQRQSPTPDLYIGKGKAEELVGMCQEEKIGTVIFNNDLSPTHQRNLEEIINVKTIDRSQLILDIFAKHAKSQEGKTQVELAQLQYLLPRLTGKGIMLSRLGGGIGTRGPGEQKLEVDRRRIRQRITRIERELQDLRQTRTVQRKRRVEAKIPQVCLVGYTNSGKSTLLNALTDSEQLIRDSLFTTLDTTSRALVLNNQQRIVLSDTVGFLYRLPHHLIEAFKATLEEVRQADLLLHILDISNPLFKEHSKVVYEVLRELDSHQKPIITVLNKIDKLDDRSLVEDLKREFSHSVAISAKNKENLSGLCEMLSQTLGFRYFSTRLFIPLRHMNVLDLIYQNGKVEDREFTNDGLIIKARLLGSFINNLLRNKEIKQL